MLFCKIEKIHLSTSILLRLKNNANVFQNFMQSLSLFSMYNNFCVWGGGWGIHLNIECIIWTCNLVWIINHGVWNTKYSYTSMCNMCCLCLRSPRLVLWFSQQLFYWKKENHTSIIFGTFFLSITICLFCTAYIIDMVHILLGGGDFFFFQ